MIYIYKTDTVWGIGASIDDELSHSEICKIKKTSKEKPISILFNSIKEIEKYFNFPFKYTEEEILSFFSDQMTILLPLQYAKRDIPGFIVGTSDYVGIRCLSNKRISKIIGQIDSPITTTSLNITGEAVAKNSKEAKEFISKHFTNENKYLFIDEVDEFYSMEASTILQIDLEQKWSLIRGEQNKLEKYKKVFSA